MRNDEFRVRLNVETNIVTWLGVDTGKTTLVARNNKEEILALHKAGGMHWSGRGQTSYSPSRFEVHRFESKGMIKDNIEELIIIDLWGMLTFSPRINKKKKDNE